MHPYFKENLSHPSALLGCLAVEAMTPGVLESLHDSGAICDFSPAPAFSGALVLWRAPQEQGLRGSARMALRLADQLRPEAFTLLLFRARKEAFAQLKELELRIGLARRHFIEGPRREARILLTPELKHLLAGDVVTVSEMVGASWVEKVLAESLSVPANVTPAKAAAARQSELRFAAVPGAMREFTIVSA